MNTNRQSLRGTRKKGGFAYLSTLFLLFLASTLGLALAALAINGHRLSYQRRDGVMAFDLAEAGLRQANIKLNENSTYVGETDTTFGNGKFTVTVATPTGQPRYRNVVSEGKVTMYNGHVVKRKVAALIDISVPVQGLNYAMFSDKHMEFSGNATINSSPVPHTGDIHSNGTMYFSGNPQIDGHGSATGNVTYSGSPTFTAGMEHNAPPVTFPTIDTAAIYAAALLKGTISGDVKVENNEVRTLSGVITGKLEVSGNGKVIVDGPLYVTGEALLKGRDIMPGPDGGSLLSPSKITVGGYGGYNADPNMHNNLKIISTRGGENEVAIDFSSASTKMKAAFYAPNGKVNVSGDLDLWGMLIAKKVYLSGNMIVRRNTNYEASMGEQKKAVIKTWQEQTGNGVVMGN